MRHRNPIPVVAAILMLVCGTAVHAQDYKMTALFVINFAKYFDWDADQVGNEFVIAVLGDDPVTDQLKALSAEAKIGEKSISIVMSESMDKIPKCNILYISPEKSNQLATAVEKFSAARTLVVTSKEGLGKAGAGINITKAEGKMGFEINSETLKKSQLKPKPVLFKVGKTCWLELYPCPTFARMVSII